MSKSQVTPYNEADQDKKGQVTRMFDKIAPYYDFLNRLLSAGIDTIWRKKAMAKLSSIQPKTILDIATGTADLALEAVRQYDGVQVVGLDISVEMLEIGRKKVAKKKLNDQIELVTGDSENLQFEDNKFDGVTAAFGVRNFGNLKAGLKEMYRVLRPGGKLVILEFSRPKVFPIKQLYNSYFKYVLPVIGRVTSKDPRAYQYLYESVQSFPDYENFDIILKEIGFKNTSWNALSLGICTIYWGEK